MQQTAIVNYLIAVKKQKEGCAKDRILPHTDHARANSIELCRTTHWSIRVRE
jgi:hypothetical protein